MRTPPSRLRAFGARLRAERPRRPGRNWRDRLARAATAHVHRSRRHRTVGGRPTPPRAHARPRPHLTAWIGAETAHAGRPAPATALRDSTSTSTTEDRPGRPARVEGRQPGGASGPFGQPGPARPAPRHDRPTGTRARRWTPAAHCHARRRGVRRRGARGGLEPRPRDVRPGAPRRPVLPPTRPAGRVRRPRDPSRARPGHVAGRGEHVGRLRPVGDRSAAGDPGPVERRPHARHARARHRRTDAADRWVQVRRRLGPAPGPRRRPLAGRLRLGVEVLPVPPGRGRRAVAGPSRVARRGDRPQGRPRATTLPRASTATGGCSPRTGATDCGASANASRSSTSGSARSATVEAPYPTNIPWPSVVREGDDWLMVAFNGRRPRRRAARLRHARRRRRPARYARALTSVPESGRSGVPWV